MVNIGHYASPMDALGIFYSSLLLSLILLVGLDPWPLDPLDPPKFF